MEILVLADTHLSRGLEERLPLSVLRAIEGADLLLHAGDVTSSRALTEFRELADLRAVLGNNDTELVGVLPEELRFELEGVRFAMLHDSGDRTRRAARMSNRFPDAEIVVYGHSHVPDRQMGLGGQLLFNPGSPTQRRAQPHASYGRITVSGGALVDHQICEL